MGIMPAAHNRLAACIAGVVMVVNVMLMAGAMIAVMNK